jgi:NAD(P)-dependent dehydrogenase (short-subunit alcohol dehydrogenase family)
MLDSQIAWVTGGAKGLGKAIATRLAKQGCNIIINDIDEDALKQTEKEILTLGRKCFAKKADVSNSIEVGYLVEKAVSLFGRIDILVNNAGGSLNTPRSLDEGTEEDWDRVIDANLKGTYLCSKAVAPHMKSHRYGVIVNISSITANQKGIMTGVYYSSAKAGVLGLTRWLAVALGPFNIRVNAITPGLIMSGERLINLLKQRLTKEERDAMLNDIPLGRFGEPEDIAGVVSFLCSKDSSYITGATIEVNGGALYKGHTH